MNDKNLIEVELERMRVELRALLSRKDPPTPLLKNLGRLVDDLVEGIILLLAFVCAYCWQAAAHPLTLHNRRRPRRKLGSTVPPRAERLLYLVLPKKEREYLPGDLEEEFRTKILPKFGKQYARRWYWKQVVFSVGFLFPAAVRRLALVGILGAWLKHLLGI